MRFMFQAMKSTVALSAFFVAVGVAADLCGDAPGVENSVLLQHKRAANESTPNCDVDFPGEPCNGVYHIDANGQVTGPGQLTPVKAKKSQAKSAPKSIPKSLPPVGPCSCDKDKAFIMSVYSDFLGGYLGLKSELEKYISTVELLEEQTQGDFQLPQKFPAGTPGPCLYFVYFSGDVSGLSTADQNFLKTRATTEGATVLINGNFFNTKKFLIEDFFPGASVAASFPFLGFTCGTFTLAPSSQPTDTIAQALTDGIAALPAHQVSVADPAVTLPTNVQVIWKDTTAGRGDVTWLLEYGTGMVIWDGTLWVYNDNCGLPLPGDTQTYIKNLVSVTRSRACVALAPPGNVEGDPHIKTLDGFHYTLMSQGTFLLWQFSGLNAKVPSKDPMNVNWQVYVHYSGLQSYTKGLLLVDSSGGSVRQMLELTSEDCAWRAKKGNGNWFLVQENQMISVHDNFATGFMVNPKKNKNTVKLKMGTDDGQKDIAVLSASCRPGHFINLAVAMKRPGDERYVDGELRVSRKHPTSSLSMLQTDDEFAVKKKWQELGGSHKAASYLQGMDQPSLGQSLLVLPCDDQQKTAATQTCSKHLGAHMEQADGDVFSDCVYDVCHGGGEVAAELAAELFAVTS